MKQLMFAMLLIIGAGCNDSVNHPYPDSRYGIFGAWHSLYPNALTILIRSDFTWVATGRVCSGGCVDGDCSRCHDECRVDGFSGSMEQDPDDFEVFRLFGQVCDSGNCVTLEATLTARFGSGNAWGRVSIDCGLTAPVTASLRKF